MKIIRKIVELLIIVFMLGNAQDCFAATLSENSSRSEELFGGESVCPEEVAEDPLSNGIVGDIEWKITKDGTLYITGSGDYHEKANPAPWLAYKDEIKTAIVMVDGMTSMKQMFSGCKNLKTVMLARSLSTVEDMSGLFEECSSLEDVPVSLTNTSNVKHMDRMFYGCTSFTKPYLSFLQTSNVETMKEMFARCENLEELYLDKFDTANVTDMSSLFESCRNLKTVDLSSFNTSKVTNMTDMFFNCQALESVDVTRFDVRNVKKMTGMFQHCVSLQKLDLNNFYTHSLENMIGMFAECKALTKLQMDHFDTSHVTSLFGVFEYCELLEELDISGFDVKNVESMERMFQYCYNLKSLDLGEFQTQKLTSMDSMFLNCKNLESLDLGKLSAEKVTSLHSTFYGCESLRSFKWVRPNTSNVKKMTLTFYECKSLKSLDLSNFDTGSVESFDSMFYGCSSLGKMDGSKKGGLDISGFDTSNATTMLWMFRDCKSLEELNISGFRSKENVSLAGMFYGCASLKEIDVSSLGGHEIRAIAGMFCGCASLEKIDISMLETGSVTSCSQLFSGCKSLTEYKVGNLRMVENVSYMFEDCKSMQDMHIEKFIMTDLQSVSGMFKGCSSMETVNFDGFSGKGTLKSMNDLFSGCEKLTEDKIYHLSNLRSSTTTDFSRMYKDCRSMKNITLYGLNLSNAENISELYRGCSSLSSADLGTDYLMNVKNADGLFQDCSNLTSINISRLRVKNNPSNHLNKMFYGCTNFVQLYISDAYLRELLQFPGNNFEGCEFFSDVHYYDSNEMWNSTEPLVAQCTEPKLKYAAYHLEDGSIRQDLLATGTFQYPATGGFRSDEINTKSFSVNLADFYQSSYTYHHNLNRMSVRVSLAGMATGSPTNASHIQSMMDQMNVSNQYIHYPMTSPGSIGYAIGCRRIYSDNEKRTLIMVAVRGGGYENEWGSNFNVGTVGNHAGFNSAADQVCKGINQYAASLVQSGFASYDDIVIWISGYSRGAAVTNLAAAKLDTDLSLPYKHENIYAFCFECPQGTVTPTLLAKDAAFENITNVVNPKDVVTKVAMRSGSWGFRRYGHDYHLPDAMNTSSKTYALEKERMINQYKSSVNYNVPQLDEGYSYDTTALTDALGVLVSRERYAAKVENIVVGKFAVDSLVDVIDLMLESSTDLDDQEKQKTKKKANPEEGDLISAHFPEFCISWLDSLDEADMTAERNFLKIFFNCPVDVSVYDTSDDSLVGQIENDQAVEMKGILTLVDDNGQKIVYLPKDANYRVVCKATDDGKMTVSTALYEGVDTSPLEVECFRDLTLKKGEEYELKSDSSTYAISKNGVIISPSVRQEEGSVVEYIVKVKKEGNGSAVGNGVFTLGEFCKVQAIPANGEDFIGWYQGDKCLSKDREFRFCITKNEEVTAKFTDRTSSDKAQDKTTSDKAQDDNNTVFKYKGYSYRIKNDKEVSLLAASKKSITVPGTVNYKKKKYKVTAIEDGAIRNNKKVQKVVIGKNVKTIGSKAFYNCKKLKSIKIQSKKLSKIGYKAFANISKKAVINCPRKMKKRYKKLLKKSKSSRVKLL